MEDECGPPEKKLKCENYENEYRSEDNEHKIDFNLARSSKDDTISEFQTDYFKNPAVDIDHVGEPTASCKIVLDKEIENKCSRKLCERDVGITEYINAFPGIPGILKQRYSDFVVRERNLDGKFVELTDTESKEGHLESEGEIMKMKEEVINSHLCPLSNEEMTKIECWLANTEKDECKGIIQLGPDNDKEHRKLVHQFIKKQFPQLDTETTEASNGDKAVQISLKSKSNNKRKNRSDNLSQTQNSKYCHFVLYKENTDTMTAVNKMADILHVRPTVFSYAGTKDKRAITIQRICAHKMEADKLLLLNSRLKYITVGSFKYHTAPLKLGDLTGNHFSIVLRELPVELDRTVVSNVMDSLQEKGFINYFGMQRFGSGTVSTFEIGKAVLRSDWQRVINLILSPREGEEESLSEAKRVWSETNDSREALKLLKRRKCIEGQVLDGLAKLGKKSFYNAFQRIARNTRLMYLHSYQSYIWNQIVSRRLKQYGLKVLTGDLVLMDEEKSGQANSFDASSDSRQSHSMTRCQTKHITQEDLDSNQYKITDIVMPLPGYDIIYPQNALKDLYTEILANDGFSLDDMRHKIKDYSLSGAYRYVVVKPESVNWSIIPYDDKCIPLIQTDLDKLQGKPPPVVNGAGKLRALKIEFTLPPSSYATMAIREVTKLDSSSHQQSKLNTETE